MHPRLRGIDHKGKPSLHDICSLFHAGIFSVINSILGSQWNPIYGAVASMVTGSGEISKEQEMDSVAAESGILASSNRMIIIP